MNVWFGVLIDVMAVYRIVELPGLIMSFDQLQFGELHLSVVYEYLCTRKRGIISLQKWQCFAGFICAINFLHNFYSFRMPNT